MKPSKLTRDRDRERMREGSRESKRMKRNLRCLGFGCRCALQILLVLWVNVRRHNALRRVHLNWFRKRLFPRVNCIATDISPACVRTVRTSITKTEQEGKTNLIVFVKIPQQFIRRQVTRHGISKILSKTKRKKNNSKQKVNSVPCENQRQAVIIN